MIINIYPTNTIPPVGATGVENNISNLQFFEALLSAQNENTQQLNGQKSSAQQPAHETTTLRETALLNLSPQALSYLNGVEETGTQVTNVVTAEEAAAAANADLTTATQKQNLNSIVAEFNNAPLSENTLSQIQGALLNAGINPDQVSLQEVLQILTTPTFATELDESENASNAELTSELLAA